MIAPTESVRPPAAFRVLRAGRPQIDAASAEWLR